MSDNAQGPGLSARAIGLVILVAVLAASAAHAVQKLLIGEASTAISGAVATTIVVIVILARRKQT